MTKPLLIFGTGEIADIAFFYFSRDTSKKVCAFVCDPDHTATPSFHGLPVVSSTEIPVRYPPDQYDMFIAIGYSKLNAIRKQKYNEAKIKKYTLASYISSKATLWDDTTIGDNCFILEHNNIQPYVRIGNNVTLWSGNHIGHHSTIHDHCFIASHVVVSGGVIIGESCFIGVNATIRDHINVGKDCVIGANAYINHDTGAGKVYTGQAATSMEIHSSELKHI